MKNIQKEKTKRKNARKKRARARLFGTAERPRAVVQRSLKHIYVQFIDDEARKTLLTVSDRMVKVKKKTRRVVIAKEVGQEAAKRALKAGIKQVVFDRGSYKYHGRVRAIAEGMREGGLTF